MSAAESSSSVRVRVGGGRDLAVALWGEETGRPLFVLHGTPGSRLLRHVGLARKTYADLGVRAITYDRPGYGESTSQPGRRVIDAAADVECIADALGLGSFGVFGISGGAGHALAVAAALSTRVLRCATVVATAPLAAPDLAFFGGMASEDEQFWQHVRARDVGALLAEWAGFVSWNDAGLPGLSVPDPVIGMLRGAFTAAVRQGPEGYLEDWLAFSEAWGFEMHEVEIPVRMMFARHDLSIPAQHIQWYEQHVPDVAVVWVDGDHFGPREEPEMDLVQWAAWGS